MVMVEFGTGQRSQLTNTAATTYAGATQSLYGVWDWNLNDSKTANDGLGWNAKSSTKFVALSASASGLSTATTPYVLTQTNLVQQTLTASTTSPGAIDGTNYTVCWKATTTCGSGNNKFGWYVNLQSNATGSPEQVVASPVFYQGAFIVNTIYPASNSLTSCTQSGDSGYTYVISVNNGGTFSKTFLKFPSDVNAAGVMSGASGSPNIVNTVEGITNLVSQCLTCKVPTPIGVELPNNTKAARLTWVELR
jgi:type IV pilus assembly protein PilY1